MKINYDAVAEFLLLGFVLGDDTFSEGEKAERIVDVPEFETNRNSSVSDVEESLKVSIENAVRGKENIAIHLSGGKDRRLIVKLVHALGLDFTAVTYGEKGSVDIEIAKKVAKKIRVPHRISEIMDTWDFKKYPKDPLEAMKKRWGYLPIVKEEYQRYIDDMLSDLYDGKSLEEILFDTTIKNLFLRSLGFYIARGINICPVVLDEEVLSNVYSLPLSKRRNC